MNDSEQKTQNPLPIIVSILSLVQIPIYIFIIRLMMDVKTLVTVAVFVFPAIAVVLLILNVVALKRMKKSGEKGKGIAIGGILLGSISTLLVFMYAATVVLFLTSD